MTPLLRLARIGAGIAWLVLRGMLTMRGFPRMSTGQRRDAIRRWSRDVLDTCGIELRVDGAPHAGACLLAINHVSWLDILALNAAAPTRFVAKADVDRWPVLGGLARGAGTLFIERERARDAMRVMHDMARCLREGEHVSVFPEGTTSAGDRILPLHANLFQAAVSAGVPVQPVLLRYVDAATGAPSPAPAYIGDDSIGDTLRRIAAAGPLAASVQYLAPIHGAERRALARAVQETLEHALAHGAPAPAAPPAAACPATVL